MTTSRPPALASLGLGAVGARMEGRLMDWTVLAGTALGGAIGLMGDTVGRILGRRQAERAHEIERREAVEREIRESARDAAATIISTINKNTVALIDPEGL